MDRDQPTSVMNDPFGASEQLGERTAWESHHVSLTRVPGYGFGIAVSGGKDNPHFSSGDPSIAVSDVLKAGPAEGKLQVNDRIVSANGVPLENVDYATAVQVLRDSGNTATLVVRRRVALPPSPEPHTLRVTVPRSKKKDDFGIVLGCKIYVREVSGRGADPPLAEGDVLLQVNNHTADGLTLKEVRKLMDSSKDRLSLVIRREGGISQPNGMPVAKEGGILLDSHTGANYSAQNLYVQPPTRSHHLDDKSNLVPRGRSRGPLLDHMSLSQLDQPASPGGHNRSRSGIEETDAISPPRPPPPRPEDFYSNRRQLYDEDPLLRPKQPMPDPRFITFQKEGSVGIRLTGGNEVGIFVTAVQPGSPASLQGLQPGDKIIKVNDMDMKGVTREEAVLFLLSLQDQIDLIVQHRKDEYEQTVASQRGDSFHIKAHFNYDQPNRGEMSFRKGDVFHVVDTLHNGVVGSWQVFRIGRNNQEVQKGIIPNKARAEELATAQFNANKKEQTAPESRGSFFRRKRNSHRRSKSLSRDHWDDVVFADSISKFPAYERVVLRHPGFIRPVVLFGPVADVARDRLLKDFPDKFTSPQLENNSTEETRSQKSSRIIRLSAIRDIMDRGKHALLDITPNAVDRLNYAQFYPIVILLRAESKNTIKELRAGAGLSKSAHKSSKKLLEQCQKLEKVWGHVFTCSVTLAAESWYRKVRDLVDKQQASPVWISESKPDEALSDDFLFPMMSRLSYASSPESDLDLSPEPRSPGGAGLSPASIASHSLSAPSRLVKSSSDPSIATVEDSSPGYNAPPPYSPSSPYSKQPTYDTRTGANSSVGPMSPSTSEHGSRNHVTSHPSPHSSAGNSTAPTMHLNYPPHPHPHSLTSMPRSPLAHSPPLQNSNGPPELPPRIDRNVKPPRAGLNRSATDRLFNKEGEATTNGSITNGNPPSPVDPPNYINATPHHHRSSGHNSSLERHNIIKTSSYDSVSSYDSYNNRAGLSPNAHDDLKSCNGGPASPRNHDPYRFTRSTAQPIRPGQNLPEPPKQGKPAEYCKYRSTDYNKPLPPPKTASYKPVPPPKPKNYRAMNVLPPSQQWHGPNETHYDVAPQRPTKNGTNGSIDEVGNTPPMHGYHAKSYSMAGGMDNSFSSHHVNGVSSPGKYSLDRENNNNNNQNNHGDMNGGSTLDRTYGQREYYYNMPPPPPRPPHGHGHGHHREPSGLDLSNREQRGSAFELYKKPADPRFHYMEHGMSSPASKGDGRDEVVASSRGVFSDKGGVLENPEMGVAMVIPPGALPPDVEQEIYFKVYRNNDALSPPMDTERGETLLSPLVLCGPSGLQFRVPVELRLPHLGAADNCSCALNSTEDGDRHQQKWHQVQLGSQHLASPDGNNTLSVLVDRF